MKRVISLQICTVGNTTLHSTHVPDSARTLVLIQSFLTRQFSVARAFS